MILMVSIRIGQNAIARAPWGEDSSHAFYHCGFTLFGAYNNFFAIYELTIFSGFDYKKRV